ncbi:hypothetical protein PsorP6_005586 [Peronosclerospora sorghi]|uniref:Uncharacterized protein n=1 Tax=Peronosclerospora sorghi TaxID=230839 RepID=A0ACC0W760_9STRA|nr:hypothetical protein PsorP6_005586 [Peronosclerospora sorghi]
MPEPITTTAHSWSFKGLRLPRIRNHDFYRLLHTLPPITTYPTAASNIEPAPDWDKLWKIELGLENILLPILSDLKFRMQHNGLKVRRKHKYHTTEVTCSHGCSGTEKVKHSFFGNVRLFNRYGWNCSLLSHCIWKVHITYLQDLAFVSGSLENLVIETSCTFFISYGQQHYTQSGSTEIIEFSNTFSIEHFISAAGQ